MTKRCMEPSEKEEEEHERTSMINGCIDTGALPGAGVGEGTRSDGISL